MFFLPYAATMIFYFLLLYLFQCAEHDFPILAIHSSSYAFYTYCLLLYFIPLSFTSFTQVYFSG